MIAIVDDDESVREATKSLVRSLGYEAATFGSAEEFLGSWQLKTTACLITDVRMPGMSGVELARKVFEIRPDLPVVIITGFSGESVEEATDHTNIYKVLEKPLHPAHITRIVSETLRAAQRT